MWARRCRYWEAVNPRILTALALTASSLLAGACTILGPREDCGAEFHGVGAGASVGATATSPPTMIIGIMASDPRDEPWLQWSIMSEPLRPHTTNAELRHATSTRLLFTFPLAGPGPSVSHGDLRPYVGPTPLGDIRAALSEGNAVVELRTTLPDQPLLRVPLNAGSGSNYGREICR